MRSVFHIWRHKSSCLKKATVYACTTTRSFRILSCGNSPWGLGLGRRAEEELDSEDATTSTQNVTSNRRTMSKPSHVLAEAAFSAPVDLSMAKVRGIAAGSMHSAVIIQDRDNGHGQLFVSGSNHCGQLGLQGPDNVFEYTPVDFFASHDVLQVDCGRSHTLVLTDRGFFGFGSSSLGQLATGKAADKVSPKVLSELSPSNVQQIACGLDHSLVLKNDGEVLATGWSADGQTGQGTTSTLWRWEPVQQLENRHIVSCVASADTTVLLDADGSILSVGNSEYDQTGCAAAAPQCTVPCQPDEPLQDVVDVAAGGSFSAAVTRDGRLYVCGFGSLGLGRGDCHTTSFTHVPLPFRVTSVTAGCHHAIAINENKSPVIFGRGRHGQLGTGQLQDADSPLVSTHMRVVAAACGVNSTFLVAE